MKRIILPIIIPLMVLSFVLAGGGSGAGEYVGPDENHIPTAVTVTPLRMKEETKRDVVYTEYKSEQSEAFLWECLQKYSPSDTISAGILGYFWRESFFRSDSVSGWATVLAETGVDICREVTSAIDSGLEDASTREQFIYCIREQSGGYGLGQWFSMGYLETLYDFAQEWGTSIGDAEMQCAFVVESLQSNTDLWLQLLVTEDPEEAGELIAIYYDGTAVGVGYIGDMARIYYDKYHEEPVHAALAA